MSDENENENENDENENDEEGTWEKIAAKISSHVRQTMDGWLTEIAATGDSASDPSTPKSKPTSKPTTKPKEEAASSGEQKKSALEKMFGL
ncbi:MAG: hypothetical protein ACYDC0_16750 [Acidimicrobiales bacterium]